ncbi:hypothetical protein C8J57DRAFT_1289539 [Mycena rebaudengoi]|nr:hypothetical protein C8J57DRAFT_1289539 [Mycena rebaudengoi]
MPRSQPLLPTALVEKIKSDPMMVGFESAVFKQHAHEIRLEVRDQWGAPRAPDAFLIRDDTIGFTTDSLRTTLHIAAFQGDVLAVYELLYLGATPDVKDKSGITPICFALAQLAMATAPHAVSRLTCVIRILVEQHAELNRSVDGQPLINLACRSREWDTIALLLKHGATPPRNPSALFRTAVDRAKFSALLKSLPKGAFPRPPRMCPCWSGKSVAECHAKSDQAYPDAYVCICGSQKTYGKCCKPRNKEVLDRWDPKVKRILHDYALHPSFKAAMNVMESGVEKTQALRKAFGIELEEEPMSMSYTPEQMKALSEMLLNQGLIDPAFSYALTRADFLPRPQARTGSRHFAELNQKQWNTLVDEYIALGVDKRSKRDIEREAKIGTWNGALIRVCEGPGCGKVEEPTVALKMCTTCKMACYCGKECQRAAWRAHKVKCGAQGQHEQTLPSQDKASAFLNDMLAKMQKVWTEQTDLMGEIAKLKNMYG